MIKVRLFWKIFFAFWVASVLVIALTMFLVSSMTETTRARQLHKQVVDDISQFVIDEYEQGTPFSPIRRRPRAFDPAFGSADPKTRFERRPFERRPFPPPRIRELQKNKEVNESLDQAKSRTSHFFALQIFDGDKLIFQNRQKIKDSEMSLFETYQGESGKSYQVYTSKVKAPRFIMNALRALTLLQCILILLSSGIVSFILSWTITRPLKQLSKFSQQVARGDSPPKLSPRLLARSDEIGDLANDMTQMLETIEQQFQEQQHLLYYVSHELRAPLARLQVVTALLEQQPDKASEYGQHLHEECQRIDRLIQRILDFSRLDQRNHIAQEFDLVSIIQGQVNKLQLEEDRPIHFIHHTESLMINGYDELAECAIENILRNAQKYSPSDSPIEISLNTRDKFCELTLRDHGEGINEREIEKLLKPFYRADNAMHSDGFGLGLSIVKRAMDKHKGQLKLKNHPQGGLVVTLTFPI